MLIDIYAAEMRRKTPGSMFNETKHLREILTTVFRLDTMCDRIDSIHATLNLLNFSIRCKLIPWKKSQLDGMRKDYLNTVAERFSILR